MPGLSGENLAVPKRTNRLFDFVLAGLVPATHALERLKQRRGYAEQVRARRIKMYLASLRLPALQNTLRNHFARMRASSTSVSIGLVRPTMSASGVRVTSFF